MIVAIFFAFYEQSKVQPNRYITLISIAVFMFGLSRLMSKVPSKNHDEDENFVKSDGDKSFKIEDMSDKNTEEKKLKTSFFRTKKSND